MPSHNPVLRALIESLVFAADKVRYHVETYTVIIENKELPIEMERPPLTIALEGIGELSAAISKSNIRIVIEQTPLGYNALAIGYTESDLDRMPITEVSKVMYREFIEQCLGAGLVVSNYAATDGGIATFFWGPLGDHGYEVKLIVAKTHSTPN